MKFKIENKGPHLVHFLDLLLFVEQDVLIKKLYDKTRDFDFYTNNCIDGGSLLNETIFVGVMMGKCIRSKRNSSRLGDLIKEITFIFSEAFRQNMPKHIAQSGFNRFLKKHWVEEPFNKNLKNFRREVYKKVFPNAHFEDYVFKKLSTS